MKHEKGRDDECFPSLTYTSTYVTPECDFTLYILLGHAMLICPLAAQLLIIDQTVTFFSGSDGDNRGVATKPAQATCVCTYHRPEQMGGYYNLVVLWHI